MNEKLQEIKERIEKLRELREQIEAESSMAMTGREIAFLQYLSTTGQFDHDIHDDALVGLAYDAAIALGHTEAEAEELCGDNALNAEVAAKQFVSQFKTKRDVLQWIEKNGQRVEGHDQGETVFDSVQYGVGYRVWLNGNTINMTHHTGSQVSEWALQQYTYTGEHAASIAEMLQRQAKARTPDYPEGRELDCGHVVFWQHEIMSASLGSACEDCYDRMGG